IKIKFLQVDSAKATFAPPGLPNPNHNIEFTRLKAQSWLTTEPKGAKVFEAIVDAELKSHGVIINSYYDLEAPYPEYFKNDMGRKLWLVGPVYLFNKNYEEKAQRGENNSIDGATILNWLDSKEPKSVLYVSFESQVRMAPEQFFVLAETLEASGHSFIWVARYMPESGEHEEGSGRRVLPDGFEERMTKSGKGLIVRSWAPQLLILEHRAVGGFMTHCGWNSTVEGICACLPMITWPLAVEQFYIESLVVDVLKTGIWVGNEEWMYVSFESQVRMAPEQFFVLAEALEASGHSFIWMARYMPESGEHEEGSGRRVLPKGFEERMTKSGKGLIVRSWAAQLLILEHRAVGGFMTHCGWNSTVEGICACLPMITWPLAVEQFYIESLVVDVLKTGIWVGNEEWMSLHWEPKVTVTREKVETAVKRLMGGGGEVEEMRRRARELSEKAKKAVEPDGSSDADVVGLINELKSRRK
ncbi:abscisate beta-glucosyltransferase-like, partial [Camellia sinensis]|uniref:abscisate beta-glucosyltransferase-like n=1 Tax=Camellia sinensis TaxID=4442 RepID=UPI0010356990